MSEESSLNTWGVSQRAGTYDCVNLRNSIYIGRLKLTTLSVKSGWSLKPSMHVRVQNVPTSWMIAKWLQNQPIKADNRSTLQTYQKQIDWGELNEPVDHNWPKWIVAKCIAVRELSQVRMRTGQSTRLALINMHHFWIKGDRIHWFNLRFSFPLWKINKKSEKTNSTWNSSLFPRLSC